MLVKLDSSHITQVLDLLRILRRESPTYRHYPADEVWVTAQLEQMSLMQTCCMLVDIQDGIVAGVMFGVSSCPWFSPYYEMHELLLAVRPEYRGGSSAYRLVREFIRISKSKGCRAINVGASLGISDPLAEALYKRLGFVPLGKGLVMRFD